ncbi:MAG TPA: kynureninase [Steroidobacteraceae bacterium]|jgi:kynureninase|nr:kynureninase [Steroidobacteraceae bacterium]
MSLPTSLAECRQWDDRDAFARTRAKFLLKPEIIYLDGNSLGALTNTSRARARAIVEDEWGPDLVRSWNVHGWYDLPHRLGAKIAPLIGAAPDEVLVADSTTVNLFKIACAVMMARGTRHRIITEEGNFPADIYVLQGLALLAGGAIEIVAVPRSEVAARIDESTFLVVLTHVHYKTAELFDLEAITRQAHAKGARILWDLSHSVGALETNLHAAQADFAVGCTYKYLNGGPGSPAFLYVRRDLQDALRPGLAAWMGHAAPFEFTEDYDPAPGMARFRVGTPSMISFASLEGALEIWDDIDIREVRRKSVSMSELFIARVEALKGSGLALASPREAARRGSHVALAHAQGYELMQALIARGVIGDFRAPNIVRFSITPLYLRYVDVWEATAILGEVAAGLSRTEHLRRNTVT